MTIDHKTYRSFTEELQKEANAGSLSKTFGKWVRKGWDDIGGEGARGGWFGNPDTRWFKGIHKKINPSAENPGLNVGKVKGNLPIGGKSIATGLTAALVPGAISPKDPLGRGRSTAERTTQLAAGTLGGLAVPGALLSTRFGNRHRLLSSLVGGIGGSILAERAATKPFRDARKESNRPVVDPENKDKLLYQAAVTRSRPLVRIR